MMKKFNNKYRIDSTQMQHWDYSWKGSYFITICSAHREHFFGDVMDGNMELYKIGKIVTYEWIQKFKMRPDMNLTCGEFMVMPNHFQAIVTIGKNEYNRCRDAMHCVCYK